MNISIFDGRLPTSAALNRHVVQRVQSAVRSVADRIGAIEVRFVDINASRHGQDKRCRILAHIHSGGTIAVDATRDDYYAALSEAADRLRAAVRRRIERMR